MVHKESIIALLENKNYIEASELLTNYNIIHNTSFTLHLTKVNNVNVKSYDITESVNNILYFTSNTNDITLFHLLTKSPYDFPHILNQNILKHKLINLTICNIE